MPLTGELEHLPIVDVIQLIHSTRKSGVLTVYSRRGEGQLTFNNGYIVSAIHSSDDFKIGKILLEKEVITEDELNRALASQNVGQPDAPPLISILHDQCELSLDDAYNALELLIELTLVEMISWTRGVFTLDTEDAVILDDYKYLPKEFQNINLDTQMVLMDALRIFDEKVHAGEIEISDEPYEGEIPDHSVTEQPSDTLDPTGTELSDDILGLADLEQLERKKPQVFEVLETFDPFDIHRESIVQALPTIVEEEQQKLVSFLSDLNHLDPKLAPLNMSSQAVILYSSDSFLQHAIMTVCKREGLMTFTSASREELESQISKSATKGFDPILLVGCPDSEKSDFSADQIAATRSHIRHKYPTIPQIQLSVPEAFDFILKAYDSGCCAVIPYPFLSHAGTVRADDMVQFLKSLTFYIQGLFSEASHSQYALLKNYLERLSKTHKAPDISLLVLKFVSEFFERSLTLVVDRESFILERSIGVKANKKRGISAPIKSRLPIASDIFTKDLLGLDDNHYFEAGLPAFLHDSLFSEIEVPAEQSMLLLPLKAYHRTVTLTYADFGSSNVSFVPLDIIDIFVRQAGLAMENALSRKSASKAEAV